MQNPTPDPGARLCVAHVNSERGFAGGEVQVFLLMEGLRRLGHRVVLVCPPDTGSAREAARRGIETVLLPMQNDVDARAVRRLTRVLRQVGAHLVHLHTSRANLLGGAAAWWLGLPAVSTRRMDRRVRRSWKSQLVYGRFTRATVAVSPAVVACLQRGGVARERVHLIPEAVDPARILPKNDPAAVRRALATAPDVCVLLTLAALVRRKGIDILLEALGQLSQQQRQPVLWIAGAGEERAALEKRCRRLRLDDQVRFLGRRDDTADLLAACDVFVLPSRREGLGVAALEAMAAGRPVICSDVGGLPFSVIDERTGLLVPAADVPALAHAVQRLLDDPDLRRRLGDAGPQRIAEGFLAEQMVEAHVALYRSLLGLAPLLPRETV